MGIFAAVRENQIRRHRLLQFFEDRLYVRPNKREKAVWELLHHGAFQSRPSGKQIGCDSSFLFAVRLRAEDDPVKSASGLLCRETQDGSPAPDFNVIRVGPKAEKIGRA